MSMKAITEDGKVPKLLRIVVDLTVDEDLWAEKKAQGCKDIDIMRAVQKGMRLQPPSPCWDYEIQYMKPVYEHDEDNEEHDRIVTARLEQITQETTALADLTKLPKDSLVRSERTNQVTAWRNENREHYNTYMREWHQKKAAEKKAAEEVAAQ